MDPNVERSEPSFRAFRVACFVHVSFLDRLEKIVANAPRSVSLSVFLARRDSSGYGSQPPRGTVAERLARVADFGLVDAAPGRSAAAGTVAV
ncbi:MAG: hypothetical protein ACLFM0_10870, partial [Spirochaetales bacterium]